MGRLTATSHDTAQRESAGDPAEVAFIELTSTLADHAAVLAVQHDVSGETPCTSQPQSSIA